MGTVQAKSADEPQESLGKEKIDVAGLKATVEKIHVSGIGRTKDDVIMHSVRGLFEAQDFQQVIMKAHEARVKLESLGAFKNVNIFIDTSKGQGSSSDGLEVTFSVKELKRIVGGINTLVGNNEGSIVLGARLPNCLGRGERIQSEYAYGTKNTTGFNVTLSKPLYFINVANASLTGAIFQQAGEVLWSGFKETDRGILAETSFESAPHVRHNLRWEGVWRELCMLSSANTSSFAIREEMGHSLKSSIKHVLTVDQRDASILPTKGILFRLVQELAGIGGDIGFLKHELELQTNLPLPFNSVLQGGIVAGTIQHRSDKSFNIADRFFLGGPLTLRGFDTRGAGPHHEGYALGSESYWSTALHLYTPLPFRPGRGGLGEFFKTHLFVNAGNIGNFQFGDDYQQLTSSLLENVRFAYGAGIVMRLGQVARLEVNYCVPMWVQAGDRARHGMQVGVGVYYI